MVWRDLIKVDYDSKTNFNHNEALAFLVMEELVGFHLNISTTTLGDDEQPQDLLDFFGFFCCFTKSLKPTILLHKEISVLQPPLLFAFTP